jgi:hypothetical protein
MVVRFPFRLVVLVSILVAALLIPSIAAAAAPPDPLSPPVEPARPTTQQAPNAAPPEPGVKGMGPNSPELASLKWYSMAGSGFVPSSNTMNWYYAGSGCVHPTTAGPWRMNVNLPDGATAKWLYVGYWNYANSTKTTGQLWKYDGATGIATVIATLETTLGTAGTGFKYAAVALNESINNTWNSYSFVWQGPTPATVQELCYMQLGYNPPPVFGSFAPFLRK